MSVSSYPFYFLPLKLSNKGMIISFPLLKLQNKGMDGIFQNDSFHSIPYSHTECKYLGFYFLWVQVNLLLGFSFTSQISSPNTTRTRKSLYIHTHIYTYIYTHTHIHTYIYTYTYIHIYIYIVLNILKGDGS